MNNIIKNLRKSKTVYLFLVGLSILPEIFFINQQGFYWDDWSQLFLHIKFGDSAFPKYFSYDRPGSAWTHMLFFPICGSSPICWHLLFLGLKSTLTILIYAIIKRCYPKNHTIVVLTAAFFAVCPLFSQQYISIAYSQHYTDFVLFAFSVYALIRSTSTENKRKIFLWNIASIISALLHLSISEYFAFLEWMKLPLLLLINDRHKDKHWNRKSILYFLPHLILFCGYCLYRLNISYFYPQFNANEPGLLYLLKENPLSAAKSLSSNIFVDMLYPFTNFAAKLLDFNSISILSKRGLATLLISGAAAMIMLLFLRNLNQEKSSRKESLCWVGLGIFGMLLGILPFWIMNQNYLSSGDFAHADRCFLAAMPFFCFLLAGLILSLFSDTKSQQILSVATVFLFTYGLVDENINAVKETEKQNAFYNQISERIPGIESGTAIVDQTIIFPAQGNFATASALNILYPNEISQDGQVPLWVFSYDSRDYAEHGGFHIHKRNYSFNQSPINYIYIDYDNKYANCLWVFSPEDIDNPHVTDLQRTWINHTNLSRIRISDEINVNAQIFGAPQLGWCAYYQQASLLRQQEDWETLSQLTDKVLSEGYTPSDSRSNSPFEWWPFIEGLIRTGDIQSAHDLAAEAIREDMAYQKFFEGRFAGLGVTF